MLEVCWDVCSVCDDSLNSMLEVCWEVNVYDDSLKSMLDVCWDVCSGYLFNISAIVFWEVCSVYDDSLHSMLEVCMWEVCSVYDDTLCWRVCSVPYINPPNSQGIRTMVSRAGPILVD